MSEYKKLTISSYSKISYICKLLINSIKKLKTKEFDVKIFEKVLIYEQCGLINIKIKFNYLS